MTPKHQKIADDIFKAFSKMDSCEHKWKPYKEGTLICELCGKFAKLGFMEWKEGKP